MLAAILGLGNIGKKYVGTRHNLGFEVLDRVSNQLKAVPQTETKLYRWATKPMQESDLWLIWPSTYMNLSGRAARQVLEERQIGPEEMLVIVDDFQLPLGTVRFRPNGSDGGHNGLKSLIEELETDLFPRLRLGIGPVPDKHEVMEFVLSRFLPEEKPSVEKMLDHATQGVLFAIAHRLDETMSKYNVNPALPTTPEPGKAV